MEHTDPAILSDQLSGRPEEFNWLIPVPRGGIGIILDSRLSEGDYIGDILSMSPGHRLFWRADSAMWAPVGPDERLASLSSAPENYVFELINTGAPRWQIASFQFYWHFSLLIIEPSGLREIGNLFPLQPASVFPTWFREEFGSNLRDTEFVDRLGQLYSHFATTPFTG